VEEIRAKLDSAFTNVINARKALLDAKETTIAAKESLRNREADLVLSGQIIGKNESERSAYMRSITRPMLVEVAAAEREERVATFALEVALDARRNLENALKIEEIEKW
jgi:riboflavin synthase